MLPAAKLLVKDWPAIHDKITRYPWAKQIAEQTKAETDQWIAQYADDLTRISGWGHNYFCSFCASALVFDVNKPTEHRCSHCDAIRHDDEANEAWNAAYRSKTGTQVFSAAVLYNLHGDLKYLTYIRKVLAFLSEHLESFRVRTPRGFEGRFSGINLMDAVTICWMLNGMHLVRDELPEDELELAKLRFFFPMASFLNTKDGGTPNIACWMKSALGMIGLFFGEHEWCRLAEDGHEGINKELAKGLLPQGFWYESSFHYHFYCADGLTHYAAFCALYGYEQSTFTDSVRKMYRYPLQYAFPNGKFPSPNDGWPLLSFANYARQYEWIRNVYDEPNFRYALAQCYDDNNDGASEYVGTLPRLLFGTDWRSELECYQREHGASIRPERVSRCDEDIHYVLLQNPQTSVFLKYGFVISEHAHADVMNFEIFLKDEIVSRDISNAGYGSDIFREWQRKAIAHNTVMVDRINQPNRPAGKLVSFDSVANSCLVQADDVYPGITYKRSFNLLDDRLQDEFMITKEAASHTNSEKHTFDWFFHCSGELECELPMENTSAPGDGDGYQLMQDVQSCAVDRDWQISWKLPGKRVRLEMAGCSGTTVYIFRGYEHRSDLLRWGVMVRRTGTSATYKAEYRLEVHGV